MFKEREDAGQVERTVMQHQGQPSVTLRLDTARKVAQSVNNSMRTLSERRLPLISNPQYLIDEISSLREMLQDYSVEDTKELIRQIENDRTVTHYHSRENTIQNVIFNQPHNTKHFAEYYSLERKAIRRRHYIASIGHYILAIVFSFMVGFAVSMFSDDFLLNGNPTILLIVGVPLSVISSVFIAKTELSLMKRKGEDFGLDFYGSDRHNATFNEYKQRLFNRAEWEKEDKLRKLKSQAESLNKSLAVYDKNAQVDTSNAHYTPRTIKPPKPEPVLPDFAEVQADYDKAVAVITSYELDIIKAVKYPAFNDITVNEVREMHMLLKKAGRAIKAEEAVKARKLVDELTLAVRAAERTAMRLAWSDMTESEQKDLQLAQNLIIQANDSGNTEEMRAVMYERLRKVVERLNSAHTIVPKSTVVLIEERARKELTQG